MRLHRFFIEEHLRNKKDITLFDDGLIHQLKDVFRLRAGDKLILLDNSGYEYMAEISLLAKGKVEINVMDGSLAPVLNKNVTLLMSLIKKDNFEWVLEKCTELGVTKFIPVLTDRTEKKDLNFERAEKILKEASEQSGRGKLPELDEVRTLDDVVNYALKERIQVVAFDGKGEAFKKESINTQEKIEILIGPEGGWTERELEMFKKYKIPVYSLGKQVLRAETAAIAISSLILL